MTTHVGCAPDEGCPHGCSAARGSDAERQAKRDALQWHASREARMCWSCGQWIKPFTPYTEREPDYRSCIASADGSMPPICERCTEIGLEQET